MADPWGHAAEPAQAEAWGANDTNSNADHAPQSTDHGNDVNDNAAEVIDPRAGNEEFQQAARAHGWAAPIPVNHETYAAQGIDHATWQGASARYEWKDEYGDVTPRVPQLEEILFRGNNRVRVGENIDALEEFEVSVDGAARLDHITEVGTLSFCWQDNTNKTTVQRCWSTPCHA